MRFLLVLAAVCAFAAEPILSPEDRKFIETHFQSARNSEAAQQYDQAAREYEIILKKFPIPHVYQNLGIVYYYRQKYEDAERAFEAGLHGFMKSKQAALLAKIEESKQLDKDGEAAMSAAVAEFKKSGAY